MALNGHVFTGVRGVRGFDADVAITPKIAAAFSEHGYRFCVRYVRRETFHDQDLTAAEAQGILDAGLAFMAVQHVKSESSWVPTLASGQSNGAVAGEEAAKIGIPSGTTVWCDLEGVATTTPADDVATYCNAWHQQVASAGFVPGLYVGWHAGLTPAQLYSSLRFSHYWAAYNLNSDEYPATRGMQMRQAAARPLDRVPGFSFEFQADTMLGDKLGGFPTLVGPESWLELL
ncbi:MAG TPA: glycoside hydrolase domain-containing protein [Gemmatimonadaceae bacterium]|jgi:hypothetical protein